MDEILKLEIKRKIGLDKLDEVINGILDSDINQTNVDFFNEVILISLLYNRSTNNFNESFINREQLNIDHIKTAKRLLDLIDKLSTENQTRESSLSQI